MGLHTGSVQGGSGNWELLFSTETEGPPVDVQIVFSGSGANAYIRGHDVNDLPVDIAGLSAPQFPGPLKFDHFNGEIYCKSSSSGITFYFMAVDR